MPTWGQDLRDFESGKFTDRYNGFSFELHSSWQYAPIANTKDFKSYLKYKIPENSAHFARAGDKKFSAFVFLQNGSIPKKAELRQQFTEPVHLKWTKHDVIEQTVYEVEVTAKDSEKNQYIWFYELDKKRIFVLYAFGQGETNLPALDRSRLLLGVLSATGFEKFDSKNAQWLEWSAESVSFRYPFPLWQIAKQKKTSGLDSPAVTIDDTFGLFNEIKIYAWAKTEHGPAQEQVQKLTENQELRYIESATKTKDRATTTYLAQNKAGKNFGWQITTEAGNSFAVSWQWQGSSMPAAQALMQKFLNSIKWQAPGTNSPLRQPVQFRMGADVISLVFPYRGWQNKRDPHDLESLAWQNETEGVQITAHRERLSRTESIEMLLAITQMKWEGEQYDLTTMKKLQSKYDARLLTLQHIENDKKKYLVLVRYKGRLYRFLIEEKIETTAKNVTTKGRDLRKLAEAIVTHLKL